MVQKPQHKIRYTEPDERKCREITLNLLAQQEKSFLHRTTLAQVQRSIFSD